MASETASSKTAAADASKTAVSTKPERPDEAAYKTALEKARKELDRAQENTKAAQARVSAARPGNKDSPLGQRQQELRKELAGIREKQQAFKTSRNSSQDRIKALDAQLKSKIAEQKNAKGKIPFKSVDEIDAEISRLDKQVESGRMKLVDEKKALADISSLRKQRKAFGELDGSQKSIDEIKSQIAVIKKELDNPEFKALSEEFTKITQELDSLKLEQDVAFKDLNANRDAVSKARDIQNQKYTDLKKLQDDYHSQRRAHREYEQEAARVRDARRKAERESYLLERRKKDLEIKLEEASTAAYLDEIKACDVLLRLLDPSSIKSNAPAGPGQFAAVAQRTVDASEIKGMKVVKKDDDDYFVGGGGKKGKKGKQGSKNNAAASPAVTDTPVSTKDFGKYFDPFVLEQFDKIGVQPPSTPEQLTDAIEKVKTKRETWQKDQSKKTQENIAAAKKEIERLEAEPLEETDASSSRKPAGAAAATNNKATAAEATSNGTTEVTAES